MRNTPSSCKPNRMMSTPLARAIQMLIEAEHLPEHGGGCAHDQEDQGEAGHKGQCGHQYCLPVTARAKIIQRHAGDEAEVARDQRQDAW